MAKLIAIDWDRSEARMVLAQLQGNRILVERVATAPLTLDVQETNFTGLQEQLAGALRNARFPRCPTLVAIGRNLVELRVLSLPPAPEDELPDLVRFQAQREFSNLNEQTPLDFYPLGEAGEVLAAAIPTDLRDQMADGISEAGQDSTRWGFRPCAVVSLAMRQCPSARDGVTLVIAQQSDSAELTVSKRGTVVFTRSFRLPVGWHPGETGEPLLGEVRRTIAAAQNQLSGSAVERIVLFGTPAEHGGLAEQLKLRTLLDVELVDPFAEVDTLGKPPVQSERFAAVIGMLRDEVGEERPALDFKNPRRKPIPKSNRRLYTLMGSAVAAIALLIGGMVYWKYRTLDAEIAELQASLRVLKTENEKLVPVSKIAKQLDTWKDNDRNWLDELYRISKIESLTADDFMLTHLVANDAGQITLTGRAKDAKARANLLVALRNPPTHSAQAGQSQTSKDDPRYSQEFTTIVKTAVAIPLAPPAPPQAGKTTPAQTSQTAPAQAGKTTPAQTSQTTPAQAGKTTSDSEQDAKQAQVVSESAPQQGDKSPSGPDTKGTTDPNAKSPAAKDATSDANQDDSFGPATQDPLPLTTPVIPSEAKSTTTS